MLEKREQIQQDFMRDVPVIFDENLIFGFIFGSFAKGYADDDHDIDTLVYLKTIDEDQYQEYLNWLVDLHTRYDMQIDPVYPCEVLDTTHMDRMKRNASEIRLSTRFNSISVFDQIVWIQVLADEKYAVIGDRNALKDCEDFFMSFPEKWKSTALSDSGESENLIDKPPLWFLRKYYPFEERKQNESPLINLTNNKRGPHV